MSDFDISTNRLRAHLYESEGTKNRVYLDSLGKKTGGVGHLLEGTSWQVGDEIPADQIAAWFDDDVSQATVDANELMGLAGWGLLNGPRKEAVVDFCFQCGLGGARGFRRCVAALRAGHWGVAAVEHLDSRGARQTPSRFMRRAKCFAYGHWPNG